MISEEEAKKMEGRKFDCDICGATVDGLWLQKHSDWHDVIDHAVTQVLGYPE